MAVKKKIPIGNSSFSEIIEENYYYIDKSLLIKELLDDGSKIVLLPRPRRFGKTLNMNMLNCFFKKTAADTSYLFKHLKIWQYEEYRKYQRSYPVVFITFKELKDKNWQTTFEKLSYIISNEFSKHDYLLKANILNDKEKEYYKKVLLNKASQGELEISLCELSKYLKNYYNQRVIILIDEYDMPIHSGYSAGYYDEVISFMRNLLSGALKDNEYLEKAVLTGILRVAKESIFSGLNNLNVATIISNEYSDKFGFLEDEVLEMLKYYEIEFESDDVKDWYNGYVFGEKVIYNPWSIINFTHKWKQGLIPHWINTSSNDIIKELITKGSQSLKEELEILMRGESIEKEINENIVLSDISRDSNSVWSFLLFSGYLKSVHKEARNKRIYYSLKIPNEEVLYLYEKIISSWFEESIKDNKFDMMLKCLVTGDIKVFGKILKEFVLATVSYFDTTNNECEKVYHAFVLGILVGLSNTHQVKSNRESGYGRYDVSVIPKDISKIGIIMEFKKVDLDEKEDLEIASDMALSQIEEKEYKTELLNMGIKKILGIGIAFIGKDLLVKYKELAQL